MASEAFQTIPVTISASMDGSSPSSIVQVQAPSPATHLLRKKVEKFMRASYEIWSDLPRSRRGVLATPAVLDEVIHCATAFHSNSSGTVDLIWAKKEIPAEALQDADVGYWRGRAGPGPGLEQYEMERARRIPSAVMEDIRSTNDKNLIAHFLYAFTDFWALVLGHFLIWLGCLFYYGYFCIVNPSIIVGESSKLYRIMLLLPPTEVFEQTNFDEDTFLSFLNGIFTYNSLKRLCGTILETNWEDLELPSQDYIQVLGIPSVVRYGPLKHHFALYIPKYDPYAPYHVRTLAHGMIDLDRCIRLMVKLALKITISVSPIPLDHTRQAYLIKLRILIMKEAERFGLLALLQKAKDYVSLEANGFVGSKSRSASAKSDADFEAIGHIAQAGSVYITFCVCYHQLTDRALILR